MPSRGENMRSIEGSTRPTFGALRNPRAKAAERPWLMLLVLTGIGTLNYIDRILPSILAE